MLTARELSSGLFGAWRLARFDPGGMRYFDISIDGFWKSFAVAAIVLPVFILMTAFDYTGSGLPESASLVEVVFVEATKYVMAWVAFPLLMTIVGDAMQRGERFIDYIIALNWAQLLQAMVVLPAFLLVAASGKAPNEPNFLFLIVFLAISIYMWFIAKTALQINGWTAAALVVLDIALGAMIEHAGDMVLR